MAGAAEYAICFPSGDHDGVIATVAASVKYRIAPVFKSMVAMRWFSQVSRPSPGNQWPGLLCRARASWTKFEMRKECGSPPTAGMLNSSRPSACADAEKSRVFVDQDGIVTGP